MKRIIFTILKILAAFVIAVVVWFPFGGIIWRSQSSPSGTDPTTQPATQSHLGTFVFLLLLGASLYFVFRMRKKYI